jgi:hypothetical protein
MDLKGGLVPLARVAGCRVPTLPGPPEDCVLQIRGLLPALLDLIDAAGTGDDPQTDLVLVQYDQATSTRIAELKLVSPFVRRVRMADVEAASGDTGFHDLVLTPDALERKPSSGTVSFPSQSAQKQWLISNFKIEIAGVPFSQVRSVRGVGFEVEPVPGDEGATDPGARTTLPTRIEVSATGSNATDLREWAADAADGRNVERGIAISLLSASLTQTLAEWGLRNARPVSGVDPFPIGPGTGSVGLTVEAEGARLSD